MALLTDERKREYLARGGVVCPYCGHWDIEGGPVEIDDSQAIQEIRCNGCNRTWTDIYRLVDVEELEKEGKEEREPWIKRVLNLTKFPR